MQFYLNQLDALIIHKNHLHFALFLNPRMYLHIQKNVSQKIGLTIFSVGANFFFK